MLGLSTKFNFCSHTVHKMNIHNKVKKTKLLHQLEPSLQPGLEAVHSRGPGTLVSGSADFSALGTMVYVPYVNLRSFS